MKFNAVPGRGLKASIAQIEDLAKIQLQDQTDDVYVQESPLVDSNLEETKNEFEVLIGNRNWMAENNIKISQKCENIMSEFEATGCTSILCAIEGIFEI